MLIGTTSPGSAPVSSARSSARRAVYRSTIPRSRAASDGLAGMACAALEIASALCLVASRSAPASSVRRNATIVSIALPSAQASLGASDADRQWVVTAYTLAFGGLLLLGGRFADYAGRKRAFLIGLAGFAVASAIGGATPSFTVLVAARAMQGAFAAVLAPAALSLLAVSFAEAPARATAFAVYGSIAGSGAAVGLLLGGTLTQYLTWRWCLYVNVPIAVIAAVGGWIALPTSGGRAARGFDLPGAALAAGGMVALVYASTTNMALLAVSAVLLAMFVFARGADAQPSAA